MAKGTRDIAVAAGIALFVTAEMAKAADHESGAIVLHVTNRAGIGSADLAVAEAEADRVFAAIGVRTVWQDTVAPAEHRESSALHLSVVLLSPEMVQRRAREGVGADVLGSANKAAGWAYIFAERITALAARTHSDARVLLGRVMAHEIGHLVLPDAGHGNRGIMASGIDRRPSGVIQLTFTPREGRAIHAMLQPRASASGAMASTDGPVVHSRTRSQACPGEGEADCHRGFHGVASDCGVYPEG